MSRKTEINNYILFKNIAFLIKQNDLNIGDFEKSAGVSLGYISRSKKQHSPSINFIVNTAKILGVSIDDLLTVDLEQKYIKNNWDKILGDTLNEEEKEKFKELLLELDSKNIITINIEV